MNDSKYMLTNDFKILYCPNINLPQSSKEFDLVSMDFIKYDGDLNLLESYIELDKKDVDIIIKNIFNAVIGIELDKEDMNWLEKFDSLLDNDINFITNKKLVFNYCVLKLQLIGFPKDMALKITSKQFVNEELIENYPHYSIFIDKINEILDKRNYWISSDLDLYKEMEIVFLKKIFNYKNQLKHKFDFNILKNEYLKLVGESFVPHLLQFNSNYSYLVRSPLSIREQVNYTLESYRFIIIELINDVVRNYFPNLFDNDDFIYDLISDMTSVVQLYIDILLQKDKN